MDNNSELSAPSDEEQRPGLASPEMSGVPGTDEGSPSDEIDESCLLKISSASLVSPEKSGLSDIQPPTAIPQRTNTAQFRLCVGKPSGSIFDLKNLQLRTCESLDIASSPGIAVNTLSRPL